MELVRSSAPAARAHRRGARRRAGEGALALAVTITGAAALATSDARAQSAQSAPADPPGLETSVALGAAGIPGLSSRSFARDQADPAARFAPGPALELLWGYHVTPWLSLGLHVGYSYHSATQLPVVASSGHADTLSLGGYVRWYPGPLLGWTRFAPSLTLGFDPAAGIWQVYRRNETSILTTVSAFAVPLTLAGEYNVSRGLALGLTLQAALWVPISRCATVETTEIVQCPSDPLTPEAYLFAGISGRFTL